MKKNRESTQRLVSGYVSMNSERLNGIDVDLKEAFNYCQYCENQNAFFPNCETFTDLKGFQQFCSDLFLSLHDILDEILRDVQKGLENLEIDMSASHTEKVHTLRFLHYPSIDQKLANQFNNGCGLHSDYGSITLLCQDNVGGLKVLDRISNTMIDAPFVPDSIICNCGDLMQEWTGGQYKSVPHQVVLNNVDNDRYSIAFFGQPNKKTFIPSINMTAYEYLLQRFNGTYKVNN